MEKKQTAMQALVDLLKVKDAYKECMPYIIDIIEEVYLPMEKEQIEDAYDSGQVLGLYLGSINEDETDQTGEIFYQEKYK